MSLPVTQRRLKPCYTKRQTLWPLNCHSKDKGMVGYANLPVLVSESGCHDHKSWKTALRTTIAAGSASILVNNIFFKSRSLSVQGKNVLLNLGVPVFLLCLQLPLSRTYTEHSRKVISRVSGWN